MTTLPVRPCSAGFRYWSALAAFAGGLIGGASVQAESRPPTATARSEANATKALRVVRFEDNPVIRPDMVPGEDGANICYPSVIRVPDWLPNPLGEYYMYFADHKGAYVRLAYANRVEGPWTVYRPGTLKLETAVDAARKAVAASGQDSAEVKGGHIGSPDVHVDDERKEIRMYFHFKIQPNESWGHRSAVALAKDGRQFRIVSTKPIGEPYFRVFKWEGQYFAVTRSASLARSRDGLQDFVVGNQRFAEAIGNKVLDRPPVPEVLKKATQRAGKDDEEVAAGQIRHTALKLDGNVLTVFYSRGGELPEQLYCSTAKLEGDWTTWRLSAPVPVLRPETDYEGANVPPKSPSHPELRKIPRPMFNEVRDPCIFRDDGRTYLFYSVAGERGIAGAEIFDQAATR
ncbi:MAG: hypothetical protein Q7S40_21805 [Opitutaceae bacterium]|nr:hypothetical protein [Opitutaceae bacterium]